MKKIAQTSVFMSLLFAFAACSWQMPENVSVKTKADYEFSLGTFEKELADELSLDSMMGNTGEGNQDITTLDYYPGKLDKNTQHYLLQVKVLEMNYSTAAGTQTAIGNAVSGLADGESLNLATVLGTSANISETSVGLDFNPKTMMDGMKDALGSDLSGKIEYASVPMYLYCESTNGLTADATLKMFYGDKPTGSNPITKRGGTEITVLDGDEITRTPRPAFEKEGDTVITNLAEKACIGNQPVEINTLVNNTASSIQDGDQLCISYAISDIGGSITKADALEGIKIVIYAIIDLPLKFNVTASDGVKIDINDLTDSNTGSGSSENSDDKEDLKKYLKVIDSISIKYVAYKLPFYATSGMKLGIDMVGNGGYEYAPLATVDKSKKISSSDKGTITLSYTTIEKVKEISNFNPKIQVLMVENTCFSVPREKAVEMNIELAIKTDGEVEL